MPSGERQQSIFGRRTKADLIDVVYERHGALTKGEAARVVEAIFNTVKTSLVSGRPVRIKNFGVFEVQSRPGRGAVNPGSGEKVYIPARRGLSFRPARLMRHEVEGREDE